MPEFTEVYYTPQSIKILYPAVYKDIIPQQSIKNVFIVYRVTGMTKYVPRVKDIDAVLKKCETLSGSDSDYCADVAKKRLAQHEQGDYIYPWVNSNWSYRRFVKNNYDPMRNGLDTTGRFSGFSKNIDLSLDQVDALISHPNPSGTARAGVDDQQLYYHETYTEMYKEQYEIVQQRLKELVEDINNPTKRANFNNERTILAQMMFQATGSRAYRSMVEHIPELLRKNNGYTSDELKSLIQQMERYESMNLVTPTDYARGLNMEFTAQQRPYDDPFFNKPITGEHSSSYFQRNGYCKTRDKTEDACKAKGAGHSWIGNHCYRGKYVYMDNSPRLSGGYFDNLKGLVPSTINDIISLNPSNFMGILQGYNVPGMEIQRCVEEEEDAEKERRAAAVAATSTSEHFVGKDPTPFYPLLVVVAVLAIAIVLLYVSISKNI